MSVDGGGAIEVDGLTKRFGKVEALAGISFSVDWGEVFGFLGHNGAGKTTTIRILTGRARPSEGWARVAGFHVVRERDRYKPMINAVFEVQNLYERLSGVENLQLFADLYGVDRARISELLELVGLSAVDGRKRVKSYSTGMKQRLLIARALVNRPRILFCDEPTKGLDPVAARDLRGVLQGLAEAGTTIFLTTHDMDDADRLCRRVAFLSEGRIVACDSPRELKLRYGERSASVVLEDRSEHVIRLDGAEDGARLEAWMREGLLRSIHSREGTLEDVFVELAGRPL